MFFKNLRLSARLGKAHGLLLNKNYERSYELLQSILQAGPEDALLQLVYSDLGQVEYHRGNYKESMNYMDFCITDSIQNPDQWSGVEQEKVLETVHWYYIESKKRT